MNFAGTGSEQSGWRPGLVFQNNVGNTHSPNIIALPLTSSIKKTGQPTHVVVPKCVGLKVDSMVLCENPERMSKDRIGSLITVLPDEYMAMVARANMLASSAISFLNPDELVDIWKESLKLNSKCC